MSTYPVISFLTSPQHRKQWADPFGVAGMKKLFDTLTCKRVITSIPVEFSDSQVRRIIKEGGGNLASYGYQRRLGFRFMGVLPMYFERGE
jgi:hypothetical protein